MDRLLNDFGKCSFVQLKKYFINLLNLAVKRHQFVVKKYKCRAPVKVMVFKREKHVEDVIFIFIFIYL